MRRLAHVSSRRIALLKPSALGDIAHSLPVLSFLRQRFPHAHLTWVVNRSFAPLLVGHPHLDSILPFERQSLRQGWSAAVRTVTDFAHTLRRQRFDLVIDLQCLLRTGLMALATGAPVRIGLSDAREGAGYCYTHSINVAGVPHAVERYWRVAQALGAGPYPEPFVLPVDRPAQSWAQALLLRYPRPWLVTAVGARWLTKRWPPAHFAHLLTRAQATQGGTAVLIGAPDERELADQTQELLSGPTVNLAGQTTLAQMVAVLAAADVVLANDTGPLHVAVALGRPVVAPYTCTQIARHGPFGQAGAVATTVPCAGSYLRQCERMTCMTDLTPTQLWGPLAAVLQSWTRRSA